MCAADHRVRGTRFSRRIRRSRCCRQERSKWTGSRAAITRERRGDEPCGSSADRSACKADPGASGNAGGTATATIRIVDRASIGARSRSRRWGRPDDRTRDKVEATPVRSVRIHRQSRRVGQEAWVVPGEICYQANLTSDFPLCQRGPLFADSTLAQAPILQARNRVQGRRHERLLRHDHLIRSPKLGFLTEFLRLLLHDPYADVAAYPDENSLSTV